MEGGDFGLGQHGLRAAPEEAGSPEERPLVDVMAPVMAPKRRGRPKQVKAGPPAPVRRGSDTPLPANLGPHVDVQADALLAAHPSQQLTLPQAQLINAERGVGVGDSLTPLVGVAQQVERWLKAKGGRNDDDYRLIVNTYLHDVDFHLASGQSRSKELNIDRKRLQLKLYRMALSLLIEQRMQKYQVECAVARSVVPSGLLCYFEQASYDETPVLCSVRDPSHQSILADIPSSGVSAEFSQMRTFLGKLGKKGGTGVVKMLQTQSKCAMLLDVHGSLFLLLLPCDVPLQAMGRATAEGYLNCLQLSSTVPQCSNRFVHRIRSVCCDQAGSNAKAEHLLSRTREHEWLQFLLPCDIHVTQTIATKTIQDMLSHTVSGMLHLALSLRMRASMSLFRLALRRDIRQRLHICSGPLSAEASEYKTWVLDQYFGTCTQSLKKKFMVLYALNGDWRVRDRIEYNISQPGALQNLGEIYCMLYVVLEDIFTSSQPPIFPRSRWTGADKACDHMLMMECIHGILSSTYTLFLQSMDAGSHITTAPDLEDDSELRIGLEASQSNVDVAGRSVVDHDMAALNAKDRKSAQAWLSTSPQGDLMLMRQLQHPLAELLHSQLRLSGQQWETEQQALLAEQMVAGEATQCRSYQVLEASNHTLENRFLGQLHVLFSEPAQWRFFPEQVLTISFRAKCFRLLSKAGCMVWQNLHMRHASFPVAAFQLLTDPGKAVEMALVPDCRLDSWTKQLKDSFGFDHPHLQSILIAEATLCPTAIAKVEAKHASMRRHLKGRSVQTHALSAEGCGAEWVFQSFRRAHTLKRTRRTRSRSSKKVCLVLLFLPNTSQMADKLPSISSRHGV